MAKSVIPHVYRDPLATVQIDKERPKRGVISFLADGEVFLFEMDREVLQRIHHQIAAKLKEAPLPSRRPKD